jgi:rubredoxin
VKVSFNTVDPSAFVRLKEIDRNYVSPKAKKKKEHLAKLGYLITHKCGNTSCNEAVDFIYESKKSESEAKKENNWLYFAQVNTWLCPVCSDIQTIRNNQRNAYLERRKEKIQQRKAQK